MESDIVYRKSTPRCIKCGYPFLSFLETDKCQDCRGDFNCQNAVG